MDIELACGEERIPRLVSLAKRQGIGVVISKHDFAKTPPSEEIAAALRKMKALGADLPKYAVMPHTPEDVLALLSATRQASRENRPGHHHVHGGAGQADPCLRRVFGCC